MLSKEKEIITSSWNKKLYKKKVIQMIQKWLYCEHHLHTQNSVTTD